MPRRAQTVITGPNGLLKQLVGRLINRAMAGEMTHHLGHGPTETPASDQPNRWMSR
ncbi:MAG: hypothetical protein V3V08_04535 [Nannocystaceae bacterium]